MRIAKPEISGLCISQLNKINTLTENYIKEGKLAGTVTLVARKGNIAHLECRGKMSIESNTAMHKDTIFRIYSMTKPVTAVAAMILYERGAFDLTTPISKFIPEFKDVEVLLSGSADNYKTVKPQREINISDLLTHTAGMTYDYTNMSTVDALYRIHGIKSSNSTLSLAEFTKQVAKMPLLFSPGTHYNYGVATDVLGRIIEIISGLSLDIFFKNEILLPLEMVDTDFFVPKEKHARFATNYLHQSAAPVELREKNPNQPLLMFDHPETGSFSQPPVMLSGGGGLTSTVNDYFKFTTMLLNQGRFGNHQSLLSPESVALMTTNKLPTELQEYRYFKGTGANMPGVGVGFGVAMNLSGNGEFGWSGAANTYFIVDPVKELVAIYLTQVFPFDLSQEMYREFKNIVYDAISE